MNFEKTGLIFSDVVITIWIAADECCCHCPKPIKLGARESHHAITSTKTFLSAVSFYEVEQDSYATHVTDMLTIIDIICHITELLVFCHIQYDSAVYTAMWQFQFNPFNDKIPLHLCSNSVYSSNEYDAVMEKKCKHIF